MIKAAEARLHTLRSKNKLIINQLENAIHRDIIAGNFITELSTTDDVIDALQVQEFFRALGYTAEVDIVKERDQEWIHFTIRW